MIFRIVVYVVNTLVKFFMDADKKERERAGFRLPAIIPIVFYNGQGKWTAATSMKDYQNSGDIFGSHILNLEYYLVDLAEIEEDYILSTNTMLDNIMYCDKYRKKLELVAAIRKAHGRINMLGLQEREEFRNWVKYILLSVCDNKVAVADEVLKWVESRENDMAFKYNIIRVFEEERAEVKAEGKAEGRAEAVVELLEDIGVVSDELKKKLLEQKDLDVLKKWNRLAARVQSIEEFETRISDMTHDSH